MRGHAKCPGWLMEYKSFFDILKEILWKNVALLFFFSLNNCLVQLGRWALNYGKTSQGPAIACQL